MSVRSVTLWVSTMYLSWNRILRNFCPISFPTQTQLHLSLFSSAFGLPIRSVRSLESAISTIPCRIQPPDGKIFPYDGHEQEHLVSSALPRRPKLRLDKFPLQTPRLRPLAHSTVRMPFELPFCGCFKIIRWIVQIRLAIRWCTICRGIGILAECRRRRLVARFSNWLRVWSVLRRLDTNAAFLPRVIARRLDSKASKLGSLQSIVCAVCLISNLISWTLKLFNLGSWQVERVQLWWIAEKGKDMGTPIFKDLPWLCAWFEICVHGYESRHSINHVLICRRIMIAISNGNIWNPVIWLIPTYPELKWDDLILALSRFNSGYVSYAQTAMLRSPRPGWLSFSVDNPRQISYPRMSQNTPSYKTYPK